MKSRSKVSALAVGLLFAAGSVCQAGLLDTLCPWRNASNPPDVLSPAPTYGTAQTSYMPVTTTYMPVTTMAYMPVTSYVPATTYTSYMPVTTYMPVSQTCYYQPEIRYRWVYSRVPRTSYEPVTTVDPCTGAVTTTYQPVTRLSLLPWLHREPYTAYRLTCSPSVPVATSGYETYGEACPDLCDPCAPLTEGGACPSCVGPAVSTPTPAETAPSLEGTYQQPPSTFKQQPTTPQAPSTQPAQPLTPAQPGGSQQLYKPAEPKQEQQEATPALHLIPPTDQTAAVNLRMASRSVAQATVQPIPWQPLPPQAKIQTSSTAQAEDPYGGWRPASTH